MSRNKISPLSIAVRAYPQREDKELNTRSRSDKVWTLPDAMLVFDTETRTDATQSLKFGSYRYFVSGNCVEEGLFYASDLSRGEKKILREYVLTHVAQTNTKEGRRELLLLTLREFLDKFYSAVYKRRCLLIGFNLPFDISRIASDFAEARGRHVGGFSFGLWTYLDKTGEEKPNQYRPRIAIKHIDSKRALKGFTARHDPDATDLIPEDSRSGNPENGYKFRGHLLDLRTVAFALTDRGLTLESACKEFGVEHGKQPTTTHGLITEQYIDYNRRDVLATYELGIKLLEEYGKHPIQLQVTKAYSPASIGKSYLHAMGIKPILERQPHFPKKYLGYTQSAFFGGRTSAHIRKVPVPVVYTDFLSMYPTVNNLMGLWRYVIAREIRIVENCGNEIEIFLRRLTETNVFNPITWKFLPAFVRVIPNGDILPSRGKYSSTTRDWQVGINHLYGDGDSQNGLWFSLPDVASSVILTGCIPTIIDAFRIEAHGIVPNLKPIKLRGAVEIDPMNHDFFKVVIEERKGLGSRTDLLTSEKERLDKALKVLANATSYGIYAEMIREESDHKIPVTCYGIDAKPFRCRVTHPDNPGKYCFPPLASLITGAARLMLALLENTVVKMGGTYAMEDTDSMAIVSTERGGLIPCKGGRLRDSKGHEAIRALSWKQVNEISDKFATLNPYDRKVIRNSVLKIEDDNFDSSGRQHQLYCLAISAKRYALFTRNGSVGPTLVNWSEHGLGHLLNPSDPESVDRAWIKRVWLNLIRKALKLRIEQHTFSGTHAVSRITISSPAVARLLAPLNAGKRYCDQVKPFNFLLTCHVNPFGHPLGADPNRFHLIAPYQTDPKGWLKDEWIDQYSGKVYRIGRTEDYGNRNTARVKTYGDVIREYEFHPESKCADATGEPCNKQTIGLLQRRHVRIEQIKYIGKESNSLEDVESGLAHSEQNVYTEYPDPRRDEWETKIVAALKQFPLSILARETGLSRRTLIYARERNHRPHKRNREIIAAVIHKLTNVL